MSIRRNENANYLFWEELRKNRRRGVVLCVLFAALVSAVFFMSQFVYNRSANEYFEQQSNETMMEISYQISKVVSNKIEDWYDQLDSTAELFAEKYGDGAADGSFTEDLRQMNTLKFHDLGILTGSGKLVLSEGNTYDLSGEGYVKYLLGVKDGKFAGTIEADGFADDLLLAVPITGHSGDAPAAVVGVVENSDVVTLLNTEVFGQKMSYVVIADSKGNLVVQTEAKNQFGENLLDTFATFADADVVEELRKGLEDGESSTLGLMGTTTQFVTYYTPIVPDGNDNSDYSIHNWRLLVLTRMDVLTASISEMFDSSKILLYFVLLALIIMVEVVVILMVKKRNEKLRLSCLDTVTDLIYDSRFEQDGAKLLAKNGSNYAVVSYNIMRFKSMNDRIGRERGDDILRVAAHTISDFIGRDELAAHSYADRFSVLLRTDTVDIKTRVRDLEQKLMEAEYPEGIKPEFTMGVYCLENGVDICEAVDRSRLAQSMTRDQHREISNLVVYTPQMLEQEREMNALADMEENALKNRDFIVYYQLKRNIQDDCWAGCEALVRWKDPEKGFIYPSKFIPLFEKNGFVVRLDKYVFEVVCMDLREMLDSGMDVVPVSINLSQCHFEEDDFFDEYEEIMDRYRIPHDLLEFEVTESMVASRPDEMKAFIARLHEIGCRCSMDDFGTGYSSLHSVQEFDFDTIKLDQSFFRGSKGFSHDSQLIVETLIGLSHKLGKVVVSEGIEEQDQVEFLKDKQCDIVQGYFYAKPAPIDECQDRLNK